MNSGKPAITTQGPPLPFASIANHVGAFFVVYDPYHVEQAREEIAQYDTIRSVDSPRAQVIVFIPTIRQHLESGSRVDFDVLRSGVDCVCVYDNDSARRVGKALNGTGVRVVVFPTPKLRHITHPNELTREQKIPEAAAMLQALFNVTTNEAQQLARELVQ